LRDHTVEPLGELTLPNPYHKPQGLFLTRRSLRQGMATVWRRDARRG
jgi:hypothetical protein